MFSRNVKMWATKQGIMRRAARLLFTAWCSSYFSTTGDLLGLHGPGVYFLPITTTY